MTIHVAVSGVNDRTHFAAAARPDRTGDRWLVPPELELELGTSDAAAVEFALRRGAREGVGVTALAVGAASVTPVLRALLMRGVDRAVRIDVTGDSLSAGTVASALAGHIRSDADCQGLVAGAHHGLWGSGLVPFLVADQLAWPVVRTGTPEPEGKTVTVVSEGELTLRRGHSRHLPVTVGDRLIEVAEPAGGVDGTDELPVAEIVARSGPIVTLDARDTPEPAVQELVAHLRRLNVV